VRHLPAALAALAVVSLALLFGSTPPARAQLPVTTTTSTTAKPTTTTSAPTTTTTAAPTTTTAKPRPTTTKPPTTVSTLPATTTIPTPAAVSTTTTAPTPISKHSGHFSPVFSVLAFMGLLGGLGLLALQWFLTKPGREGWTL
jgi:hypothetical protein